MKHTTVDEVLKYDGKEGEDCTRVKSVDGRKMQCTIADEMV